MEEETYNIGHLFGSPSTVVDGLAAARQGARKYQKEFEKLNYGATLSDPGFTAGSFAAISSQVNSTAAANKEQTLAAPEPDPVTLPQEDSKHQQHAAIEQDYLAGKIPYSDYIAGVNKIYG